MRQIILIIFIFMLIPLILEGMEYNIYIYQEGRLHHIIGTNYYLQIFGCYTFGYKSAILNTNTRTIYIENSDIFGSNTKYNSYYYTEYEKIELPIGTIDQSGLLINIIYIPTIIK